MNKSINITNFPKTLQSLDCSNLNMKQAFDLCDYCANLSNGQIYSSPQVLQCQLNPHCSPIIANVTKAREYAIIEGHVEIFDLLLSKININIYGDYLCGNFIGLTNNLKRFEILLPMCIVEKLTLIDAPANNIDNIKENAPILFKKKSECTHNYKHTFSRQFTRIVDGYDIILTIYNKCSNCHKEFETHSCCTKNCSSHQHIDIRNCVRYDIN